MSYRIAHISDLHIKHSVKECFAESADMKAKAETNAKEAIKAEIEEFYDNERLIKELIKLTPKPTEPDIIVTPPGFGSSPGTSGELMFANAWNRFLKEYEIWEEKTGINKLENNKKKNKDHIKSISSNLKQEKKELSHRFYDRWIMPMYKHGFPNDLFPKLLKSLRDHEVDHVIVTGDITNLSRKLEYQDFLSEFDKWIEKKQVSVVPGNHDTKLFPGSCSFLDELNRLIPDKYPEFISLSQKTAFPYVKELNENICLIGLDSTNNIKSNSFEIFRGNAIGCISDQQYSDLKLILQNESIKNKFIIIAMHHHMIDLSIHIEKIVLDKLPFLKNYIFNHTLEESHNLFYMLKHYRVNIILNGHVHCPLYFDKDYTKILIADSLADPFSIPPFDGIPKYDILSIDKGQMERCVVLLR